MDLKTASLSVRLRLLEEAAKLLAAGSTRDLLAGSAARAGSPMERARIWFRSDEDLILALYTRFAVELEDRVSDLPAGGIGERFHAAMRMKLDLLAPYREAVGALLATLLDPRHELSALGDATQVVRHRVMGVLAAVVSGSTEWPADAPPERLARVVRALYGAHLLLVLLWTQERGTDATAGALAAARDVLGLVGPWLSAEEPQALLGRLDAVSSALTRSDPPPEAQATADEVLRAVFRRRRVLAGDDACAAEPCPRCFALHLPRASHYVARGEPVHLVLPAFPAKSPSLRKVLGTLPDRAEEVALTYLQDMADEIRAIHPPGARVTICSDGRVFSDLVGVREEDVTAYAEALRPSLRGMDFFSMDDLFDDEDFAGMRGRLETHYARPVEELQARAERSPSHRAQYNGIHRFMVEEHPGAASKTQTREICRPLAWQVVQRSEAWGRVVAECFPNALRLSIHPQPPHAEKIGILLGPADDVWITPWHGVAVRRGDAWTLMKRADAEQLPGARVIEEGGRPSYVEAAP